MKKALGLSAVAVLAAAVQIGTATTADAGRRGRNVALGVAAVVGTAILLNEAARADGRRSFYNNRRGPSCRELRWRCEDGSDWACDRFDRRC